MDFRWGTSQDEWIKILNGVFLYFLVANLEEYCRWLLRWCWSNPASATVFAKVPKHKLLQSSLQRTMVWVMKSGGIRMSLSPTKIHQGKAAQTMQLALFSTWTNHTHSVENCHVVWCFLGRFWLVTSNKNCRTMWQIWIITWYPLISGSIQAPMVGTVEMIANKSHCH